MRWLEMKWIVVNVWASPDFSALKAVLELYFRVIIRKERMKVSDEVGE